MNFKKILFALPVVFLTFGLSSCDDEENTDTVTKTTWTLKSTTPTVHAGDSLVIAAIEEELSKETMQVQFLTLGTDGSYDATLGGVSRGAYKIENDSLYLIKKEVFDEEDSPIKIYEVSFKGNEMNLTEDVTKRFVEKYEGVEEVIVKLNLTK